MFMSVGATAMPIFSNATANGLWTMPGLVESLWANGVFQGTIVATRKIEST